MAVELQVGPPTDFGEYERVSIAFEVRSRLRIKPAKRGLGGLLFTEEPVVPPWWKDYDDFPGNRLSDWARRWNIARWGMVRAQDFGRRLVGGAIVAVHTPGLLMLADRPDRAALWDLRVQPALRRQGIGQAMFWAAALWAREQGCRELTIETQDINVPACRFYAAQGCELIAVVRDAYPDVPDEAQLIWRLPLR
jgi:GNAT superfamily N-acetyltransferase